MKGFNLGYLFKGAGVEDWYKALGNGWRLIVILFLVILIISGGMQLWNTFFPKKSGNIHKPTAVILPLAKVENLDQTSTQILVEEKTWEVGLGGAALTYDNKSGLLVGAWVKKKF